LVYTADYKHGSLFDDLEHLNHFTRRIVIITARLQQVFFARFFDPQLTFDNIGNLVIIVAVRFELGTRVTYPFSYISGRMDHGSVYACRDQDEPA